MRMMGSMTLRAYCNAIYDVILSDEHSEESKGLSLTLGSLPSPALRAFNQDDVLILNCFALKTIEYRKQSPKAAVFHREASEPA